MKKEEHIHIMAWALEIIADIQRPSDSEVPTQHWHQIKTFAAFALRAPEGFGRQIDNLQRLGYELPLPYDSEKWKPSPTHAQGGDQSGDRK